MKNTVKSALILFAATLLSLLFHRIGFTDANIIMVYKLLCLFARNTGRVLRHKYILQNVWGSSWENDIGTLRVFMATLRKKLEKAPGSPQYIQTHIGVGYRMQKVE